MDSYGKGNPQNAMPSRWLKCPPKSYELLNNKFLIFKTPLSRQYDSQVGDDIFQVQLVFQSMKNRRVKLGLWIDLTNTTRYYDRKEVEQQECRYVKLQCEGHKDAPSVDQTQSFIKLCNRFIRQYPLEAVGVHCTHGFNRSGFLVISYLVEILNWELGAAIAEFARVRPPGIYKQNYLTELYKRYDEVDYTPTAPPLPDWCFEDRVDKRKMAADDDRDDDDDNDDGYDCEYSSKKKKFKCDDTEDAKFMDGVSGVENVTGQLCQQIQRNVKELCGWDRSGFPGSQPVSLSFDNIHLLNEKPYSVSWKADGVRYMMYIRDRDEVYCIDRDNNVFRVKNLTFPQRKNLRSHVTNTLLDGEMVLDKQENGSVRARYLVYDAISMHKYKIKDDCFDLRYKSIEKEICGPREEAAAKGLLNKLHEPFSVRLKDFRNCMFAEKFLSESFKKTLSHPPDGLIFQPNKEPYIPGRCDLVLKWKPATLNSVDFRLKIEVESGQGIVPKAVGKLYTGGNKPFGRLQSVKNLKHLDGQIVECTYDMKTHKWIFLRERTDKSFPNSFDTAQSVFRSILKPITEEFLLDYIANHRYTDWQEPQPLRSGR